MKYRKELIPGWFFPSLGTADYFNNCTKLNVGVPQNFMGYCLPKEGLAYAGFILLLEPHTKSSGKKKTNYREYLQTSLTEELENGKTYEIQFFYFVATYSTYAINRLGVYFSQKKINNLHTSENLNYKPQLEIDSSTINYEQNTWLSFTGSYKAKGGEKYLTIGNFYDDYNTLFKICDFSGVSEIKKSKILSDQIAYYYIDQVSVKEINNSD